MPLARQSDVGIGRAFALVALVASLGACTVQDRYESVRRSNVLECERLVTQNERDRCKAQLPPASYDEYERARRSVPDRTDA
jgi:hypothetical protein